MATLNVKNFPDDLYRELRDLAAEEHRSVAQQVIHLLDGATARQIPRSILELEGLGRDAWDGIDAVDYVERERAAWD